MRAVSLLRMPANPPTALPHAQTRQTAAGQERAEQTPLAALWRTREYLRHYYLQLVLMLAAAITAAGAEIAIPLLIKGIIDGPIEHGNARALLPLGLAATALGVLQAALNCRCA
jgi:ATP-binding cassette subfamily B protein